MKTTASDVLIDSIHDWGVDVVFRLPGDGINGIQDALRKEHSEVPTIRTSHSASAFGLLSIASLRRPFQ